MERNDLLTLGQAAKALGVNRSTVGRRVAAGEISAFRSTIDRRAVLVPRRDIEGLRAREFEPLRPKETAASAA